MAACSRHDQICTARAFVASADVVTASPCRVARPVTLLRRQTSSQTLTSLPRSPSTFSSKGNTPTKLNLPLSEFSFTQFTDFNNNSNNIRNANNSSNVLPSACKNNGTNSMYGCSPVSVEGVVALDLSTQPIIPLECAFSSIPHQHTSFTGNADRKCHSGEVCSHTGDGIREKYAQNETPAPQKYSPTPKTQPLSPPHGSDEESSTNTSNARISPTLQTVTQPQSHSIPPLPSSANFESHYSSQKKLNRAPYSNKDSTRRCHTAYGSYSQTDLTSYNRQHSIVSNDSSPKVDSPHTLPRTPGGKRSNRSHAATPKKMRGHMGPYAIRIVYGSTLSSRDVLTIPDNAQNTPLVTVGRGAGEGTKLLSGKHAGSFANGHSRGSSANSQHIVIGGLQYSGAPTDKSTMSGSHQVIFQPKEHGDAKYRRTCIIFGFLILAIVGAVIGVMKFLSSH